LVFNFAWGQDLRYQSTDNSSLSKYERINKIESFLEEYAKAGNRQQRKIEKDLQEIVKIKEELKKSSAKITALQSDYQKLKKEFEILGTNNRIMTEIKDIKENILVIEKQVSRLHEENEFYKNSIKTIFEELKTLNTIKK